MENTNDAVTTIVIDELELEETIDSIDADADLKEQYEADSLGLIQVLARLNKEIGVAIPRDQASDLTTLRRIWDRVHSVQATSAI
ncbi:hypothetical protein CH253_16825 [Rhodococcus sp. 06-156-3C]|nr:MULTISPECIES: acyl carrier protein [unclassified Rhodococcus (in: high G+C Gram-positive bacteria)]OZD18150.1 hypothetical protein CH280_06150 [Rhodococcus sp. 06-156-4C]OZD18747.1 hypothetical protein CH253_16825 [Rhodococcus sp. 06-156-3C]OZD22257.1 hypothetical protein CH248_08410 [Rhodococcus sp. 06-156-4a]OZD38800.1 hypothetical protein CH284_06655 [Rhodococcus sp. 06-156-3]OZF57260.1 hypothetical protein CH290_27440 [Rhodococcus sp. 06-156-4]